MSGASRIFSGLVGSRRALPLLDALVKFDQLANGGVPPPDWSLWRWGWRGGGRLRRLEHNEQRHQAVKACVRRAAPVRHKQQSYIGGGGSTWLLARAKKRPSGMWAPGDVRERVSGRIFEAGGRMLSQRAWRYSCLGFRVQGSGFRVQGSGFRVQGSGFRVQVSGFRVSKGRAVFLLAGEGIERDIIRADHRRRFRHLRQTRCV